MSDKPKSDEQQLTADQARALLLQEQESRRAACTAAIERALQEHRCALVPEVVLTEGTVRARIRIVPRG